MGIYDMIHGVEIRSAHLTREQFNYVAALTDEAKGCAYTVGTVERYLRACGVSQEEAMRVSSAYYNWAERHLYAMRGEVGSDSNYGDCV